MAGRIIRHDEMFMGIAYMAAMCSRDPSTKVGAVIVNPNGERVVSIGYNGFPRGVDDDIGHRYDRPQKYRYTVHAERNAIFNASAVGSPTAGCHMYTPFYPCSDCMQAIIQSGIDTLILDYHRKDMIQEKQPEAVLMAVESGLKVVEMFVRIPGCRAYVGGKEYPLDNYNTEETTDDEYQDGELRWVTVLKWQREEPGCYDARSGCFLVYDEVLKQEEIFKIGKKIRRG